MESIATLVMPEHNLLTRFLTGLHSRSDIPLRLVFWNGSQYDFGLDPMVIVRLSGPGSLRYFLPPSLDNLAEGYVNGHFDVEGRAQDIVDVASKLAHMGVPVRGRFGRLFSPVRHDRIKDARAIEHHYDVSNNFYRLWLDEAQSAKLDQTLTKIMLKPGQRLLDIGCGWGALVIRGAKVRRACGGCHVVKKAV